MKINSKNGFLEISYFFFSVISVSDFLGLKSRDVFNCDQCKLNMGVLIKSYIPPSNKDSAI